MARHLYIAGVDRQSELERGSLQIDQVLTYQIDTCSFSIRGDKPSEGDEVIIEDDALGRMFAGIIVKVELARTFPDKSIKVWQVDADDWTALLDRKLVVETYENMAADAIFRDIAAKYCPGFTVNGVRSGAPVVEYIPFDYLRPSECFKQLCDYVGWHWQPDYYKDLQFFSAEEIATPAPLALEPGGPFRFGKHTIDTQGLRNRVYVRGGTMLSDPWTYEVKADGSARAWVLPHKPHDITVKVGGVTKTCGIENVHEESDYDFLMNYQEKYVRCSVQTPTPAQGVTLSFTYRYDIDVITMVEDIASQQAIAAVQGGDGVYEHSIVDDSLTTIDAAEAAGLADLREHANPRVKGSFETEVPGWAPGQLVTINLPDRGVTGTFLVQKVTITPATPELWTYRVEYGGRLLGIADWLRSLWKAQQKKKLNETTLLHKFHYGAETAKVTDEVEGTLRTPPWAVEQGTEILVKPIEIAPVEASFTRSSVAYLSDGTEVAAGVARFEPGMFGQAVLVEEGTTNLIGTPRFFTTPGEDSSVIYNNHHFKIDFTSFEDLGYKYYFPIINVYPNTNYTFSFKIVNYIKAPTSLDGFIRVLSGDNQYPSLGMKTFTVNDVGKTIFVTFNSGDNTQVTPNFAVYANIGERVILEVKEIQLEAKPYATSFTPGTRSTERLTIPTAGVLNPQEGTISLWVKPPKVVSSRGNCLWATSGAQRFDLWWSNNNRIGIVIGSIVIYSNRPISSLQDGNFHAIAVTWGSFGNKLYIDGVLDTSSDVLVPSNLGSDFYVGGLTLAGYESNSIIDDFRISNRARTDEEIAAAYASGQPLPVDEWTTCKMSFDGTLVFPGGLVAVEREIQTVGSLLTLSQPALISTSENGENWTGYEEVRGCVKVPYPGYVRIKNDKRTWAYNWKKPLVETDTVCGFVVCS